MYNFTIQPDSPKNANNSTDKKIMSEGTKLKDTDDSLKKLSTKVQLKSDADSKFD